MEALGLTARDGGASWIKRIVVAVDGSSASLQGVQQAADIARRYHAKMEVVHVRHVPGVALLEPGIGGPSALEALDQVESEVRQQVMRILGGSDVDWEFVVRSGSAGEELVSEVKGDGADLVVVGSNRHSSLHNLLLGSTAAYLTAHSPAPVLVTRSLVANGARPLELAATR